MRRNHETHVWVQTDVVQAILDHDGTLPPNWKPKRKRSRSCSTGSLAWGWARAVIVGQQQQPSTTATMNEEQWFQQQSEHNNRITVTINDAEFAPDHLQGVTVTLDPSTTGAQYYHDGSSTTTAPPLHIANSWWNTSTSTTTFETEEKKKLQQQRYTTRAHVQLPPDDLTILTHLHEPAVVYCLSCRYQQDRIYTYTGKILLALNPFRPCPELYGPAVMKLYAASANNNNINNIVVGGAEDSLNNPNPPPHVYAVAQDAYCTMLHAMRRGRLVGHSSDNNNVNYNHGSSNNSKKDQSILVSGESGSGKTVTTKIIMQYLATMSSKRHHVHLQQQQDSTPVPNGDNDRINDMESQVLQSNPILESFGNARTVRNDNSSRFGKFIEIQFLSSGCLVSASIETYLLEKVRLIAQAPGERNYHIFYELLSGMSQRDRQRFEIANVTAKDFRITASSGTFDRRDGVDDRDTHRELRNALDTVGFTTTEQHNLFVVVCALLHASNLTFVKHPHTSAGESCELNRANPSLRSTSVLLGVAPEKLEQALCLCAIEARGETLYKNLSVEQATKALDALIMATYGALFSSLVSRINSSITFQREDGSPIRGGDDQLASMGVLDIFGFECFDHNSFEQLCINYCNEALQQQFNRFVFKLEQEEYEREGIEWSFVTFPDNQDVLDLIEAKRTGILSLLDEQCRLPTCTDMSFARATYEKCCEHPRFVATNNQKVIGAFWVHHYAGPVEYSAVNFLEKNKDELPKETTELLMSSDNPFLASLGELLKRKSSQQFPSPPGSASSGVTPNRGRGLRRQSSSLMRDSVGSQFTSQLAQLRNRIDKTTPHYVRCLKPNDDLLPDNFHAMVIADQLRCAGVLEAVRVSRVGFSQRYTHATFLHRYHMLATKALRTRKGFSHTKKESCHILVERASMLVRERQQGGSGEDNDSLTSMSRNGQSRETADYGIQMGLTKVFLRRDAFDALEILRGLRLDAATRKIQSVARMFLAQMRFEECLVAAVLIQRNARRVKATRYFMGLRRNRAATQIQCIWRLLHARRRFLAAGVVARWCQCTYRGSKGREIFALVLEQHVATLIQRNWRRYSAYWRFLMASWVTLRIQSLWRSLQARKELMRLKFEARDLKAVAAERDRFREEALRLRQELERKEAKQREISSKTNGGAEITVAPAEVKRLKNEIEILQAQLRNDKYTVDENSKVEALAAESAQKDAELERLRKEIEFLRSPEARVPQNVTFDSSARQSNIADESILSGSDRDKSPPSIFRKKTSPTRSIDSTSNLGSQSHGDSLNRSLASLSLLDTEAVDNASMMGVSPMSNLTRSSVDSVIGATKGQQNKPPLVETLQFRKAVREGDFSTVETILKTSKWRDVLVNECDESGQSPLHMAVIESRWKVVGILLGNDAVANAQDLAGNTPLHVAPHASMMALLLDDGRANPNIPNMNGECALHFAVRNLDDEAVDVLLRHGAKVNCADNTKWYTPLHLIAQADLDERAKFELPPDEYEEERQNRIGIAHLLCNTSDCSWAPDLDETDFEGNTPLHHVAMLTSEPAAGILAVFLEKGANPRIANKRGQTALHLLCHNESLRKLDVFQEMLHTMLYHGADPNQTSLTGCTALHLSLYHRDVDSAIQLVNSGAELNLLWRKPKRWVSFWDDMGTSEILALDMVKNDHSLHRILAAINKPQKWAPARPWCMHCNAMLGSFARALHCRHCGRLVCGACSPRTLPADLFPKSFEIYEPSWVCVVCEKILVGRKEDNSSTTQPTTESSSVDGGESRLSF